METSEIKMETSMVMVNIETKDVKLSATDVIIETTDIKLGATDVAIETTDVNLGATDVIVDAAKMGTAVEVRKDVGRGEECYVLDEYAVVPPAQDRADRQPAGARSFKACKESSILRAKTVNFCPVSLVFFIFLAVLIRIQTIRNKK